MGRVALGLAVLYLALIPPGIYAWDGGSMFLVAESIATSFDFAIDCASPAAAPGEGACYSTWYPLLSALAAPLVAVGQVIAAAAGLPGQYVAKEFALLVPALCAAGAGAITAGLALRLGAEQKGAVAAAVAVALGTEMLTYARSFFAETLAAFLVALAVWGATCAGWRRVASLLAIGLAVLAKPGMIVVGPALGVALAIRRRSLHPAILPTLASGAGAMLYGFYNFLRFADPLDFGRAAPFSFANFLPPRLFEVLGLQLVSPGRGLLWYSPVAVLGAWVLWRRRGHETAALCLAGSVGILAFYVGQPQINGGWDWGGRFLVPTLPLLCAPLAFLRGRQAALAAVLVAAALVGQIPTTLAFFERTYAEQRDKGVRSDLVRWSVETSPLVTSWPAMVRQVQAARRTDVEDLVRAAGGPPPSSVEDEQLFQVVAVWWWMVPLVGLPAWAGITGWVASLGLAGWLLWGAAQGRVRRHSSRRPMSSGGVGSRRGR